MKKASSLPPFPRAFKSTLRCSLRGNVFWCQGETEKRPRASSAVLKGSPRQAASWTASLAHRRLRETGRDSVTLQAQVNYSASYLHNNKDAILPRHRGRRFLTQNTQPPIHYSPGPALQQLPPYYWRLVEIHIQWQLQILGQASIAKNYLLYERSNATIRHIIKIIMSFYSKPKGLKKQLVSEIKWLHLFLFTIK